MTPNQADEMPSIIHHLSVGTNSPEKAFLFYDKVLATVGAKRIADYSPDGVAYGKLFPEFWVHPPHDRQKAEVGNGWHISFNATSEAMVQAFYNSAIDAGGTCDGKPGPREDYGPCYYGCYVRDLDGNKIEATFWDESKAK
ncbi:MAG: VOC family protein [Agarilytica sp.]